MSDMKKQEAKSGGVEGDRALRDISQDRLGFREIAERMATALVDQTSNDGLVIGIDGQWGSGKSSLLFLIEETLNRMPKHKQPTVIPFRPWLLGSRDALLSSLFTEFARGIERYEMTQGDTTRARKRKVQETAENMRAFGHALSKFGGIVELVGNMSMIPAVAWVGKLMTRIRDAIGKGTKTPSLLQLKSDLTNDLIGLGHRFVVTIDDVDRLEPADVMEVVRLVRSVADFPNVVYLLCYDSSVLAHSIEQVTKVQDGKAFLEKIVQLTVLVPHPEPFQLRQWFGEELKRIATPKSAEEFERLRTIIDLDGGRQLKTPRAVVRALDSIRFAWPALRKESADLADLVWILLIKSGNPTLYRWIEKYCGIAALLSLGTARVDDVEKKETLIELMSAVDPSYFDDPLYTHHFAEQLPAARSRYAEDGDPLEIFKHMDDSARNTAIAERRLKSPDHYRLYFALSGPSFALAQTDYGSFWNAADEGPDAVGDLLLRWHKEIAVGSLSKAEILLERLTNATSIDPARSRAILAGMANALDDAYAQSPFDDFSYNTIWDRAEALVPILLKQLSLEDRAKTIQKLFGSGKAIGWLTSLLRHDTFAQGRYGKQSKPEEGWLFSANELDEIVKMMVVRYRGMTLDQLLASPSPLDLLFAWIQTGDKNGPRNFLAPHTKENASLVAVVEGLVSRANSSSRGLYAKLSQENIAPFMDYDFARRRMIEIAAGPEESELVVRARRLVEAFEVADRH